MRNCSLFGYIFKVKERGFVDGSFCDLRVRDKFRMIWHLFWFDIIEKKNFHFLRQESSEATFFGKDFIYLFERERERASMCGVRVGREKQAPR